MEASAASCLSRSFNWWAGLVLLLVLIYGVRRMRIAQVEIARTQFQQSRILRRADYLRDFLLVPGAEKEVRVFGLAPWLRGRFQAEWDDAMGRVWQQRRSSVRDAALAIAPVLLVAAGLSRSPCTIASREALLQASLWSCSRQCWQRWRVPRSRQATAWSLWV